jgi:hypothetical protein
MTGWINEDEIPCPNCGGHLAIVVNWLVGTSEGMTGWITECERFFVSLPASDGAFDATSYVTSSVWSLCEDFSSVILAIEEERRWEQSDET